MGDLPGVLAILMVFGIPMLAIWTGHRRKMLELQLQMRGQVDTNANAEIAALREEVRALRDTTMQYDLSFDAALQRMERRVQDLETQSTSLRVG